MREDGESIPAYQTIRVTAPAAPVAELADLDAWQAREAYPDVVGAGGPVFGVAREREEGGWALEPYFGEVDPQSARDSLALGLRVIAPVMRRLGPEERAAYARAALRLEEERCNDLDVGGRHLRVVRVERLVRIGPDGPEGPRAGDVDFQPPVKLHEQQLRAQGNYPTDEDEPFEVSPEVEEMNRLMDEERQRRADLDKP